VLGYADKHGSKIMTLPSKGQINLTDDEWNEMDALRRVIAERPQALVPEKMEKFTEYFVRSLKERGC
jgi:hypothetical protein